MFADDVKLYMPIYSVDDCVKLQTDLNTFCWWCSENGLSMNAKKCSQISFSRKKSNLKYRYKKNTQH